MTTSRDEEKVLHEWEESGQRYQLIYGPSPAGMGLQSWDSDREEWKPSIYSRPLMKELLRLLALHRKHEAEVQTQYSLIANHVADIAGLDDQLRSANRYIGELEPSLSLALAQSTEGHRRANDVARLLAIYDHAHATGNSVPPHLVREAKQAIADAKINPVTVCLEP